MIIRRYLCAEAEFLTFIQVKNFLKLHLWQILNEILPIYRPFRDILTLTNKLKICKITKAGEDSHGNNSIMDVASGANTIYNMYAEIEPLAKQRFVAKKIF